MVNKQTQIKINTSDYKVEEDFYNKHETLKTKICLLSTLLPEMKHIDRLSLSKTPFLKNAPTFTINEDGTIYQHFECDYYSEVTDNIKLNEAVISIALVNNGWLSFDAEEDTFKSWSNVVIDKEQVFEKVYREYRYWEQYTDKQQKSTLELCIYLCEKYNIKKDIVSHLFTYDEDILLYNGIFLRNNVLNMNTCINPSFDMKKFYKAIIKP